MKENIFRFSCFMAGVVLGYSIKELASSLGNNLFLEIKPNSTTSAEIKVQTHNYEIELGRFKYLTDARELVTRYSDLPSVKVVKDSINSSTPYHVRAGKYNRWMEAKKAIQDLSQSPNLLEPTIVRVESKYNREIKC
jgi:SPOR domain